MDNAAGFVWTLSDFSISADLKFQDSHHVRLSNLGHAPGTGKKFQVGIHN